MIIIGITGSIGMGKSTIARQFAALGAKMCKADDVVHALLSKGGAGVGPVANAFPESAEEGAISREKLGKCVFGNPAALARLEAILHPLVAREEKRFVDRQRRLGARIVALDIPLLFETGAQVRCTHTVVVTAPSFLQRRRVLRRKGMNAQKLVAISERQLPDRDKRKHADFVIHTGLGKAYSFREVKRMMRKLGR